MEVDFVPNSISCLIGVAAPMGHFFFRPGLPSKPDTLYNCCMGIRLRREGSMMIDTRKLANDVIDEVKSLFPDSFGEHDKYTSGVLTMVALVAAIAIDKYAQETGRYIG